MFGTLANQKYDEIPMWNRDKLWKCNLIGNDDEIPIRERDELWRRNSFGEYGEIPMRNRDKYGKVIYLEVMMKFRGGIETIREMQ